MVHQIRAYAGALAIDVHRLRKIAQVVRRDANRRLLYRLITDQSPVQRT